MELLRTMSFKLELFAGTDVYEAASDLCRLADRIGVLCVADFNGVKLWARPGDDYPRLVDAYFEQLKRPGGHYKIAQVGRPR